MWLAVLPVRLLLCFNVVFSGAITKSSLSCYRLLSRTNYMVVVVRMSNFLLYVTCGDALFECCTHGTSRFSYLSFISFVNALKGTLLYFIRSMVVILLQTVRHH